MLVLFALGVLTFCILNVSMLKMIQLIEKVCNAQY